jgi:hypothetical protein
VGGTGEPVITASRARAEWKVPTLRQGGRRAALGRWIALAGTLVAVGAVIALIMSWANDGTTTLNVAQTTPTETLPAVKPAAPATAPAPAPTTARPAVRARRCDPIFGGGTPHPVTSSARDGDPVGCGEAHSVLLAALNGGATGVGGWHCTTSPNGQILAACTSTGGRRIVARD